MPAVIRVVDGRTIIRVGENTIAAVAAAAEAQEWATRAANAVPFTTWAALAAATDMVAGDRATVTTADTGTHTDPVAGGTVSNSGIFAYSASPAGWQRIGNTSAADAAAWAEGTLPGGPGTKSAEEWAAEAEEQALDARAYRDQVLSPTLLDLEWSIVDSQGRAAFGVTSEGALAAEKAEIAHLYVGDAVQSDAPATPDFAWSVQDGAGKVALGVKTDGTVVAAGLAAGADDTPDLTRFGGTFAAQSAFMLGAGQSLMMGATDGVTLTTVQEYDNIGFPWHSTSPATALPLTTALSQGGNKENPMFGAAGHLKELILEENGIAFAANDYKLLVANTGNSGAPIDEISKGGVRGSFEAGISQVQSGFGIAASVNRTFVFQSVSWMQGESDDGMPTATYLAKLKQIASDYNTDGKAITGQSRDVQFITYQLGRYGARDTVTPAYVMAAEQVPYIHLATPIYFMDFVDGTHQTAVAAKWAGGYFGLVDKRVNIDRVGWEPLKPKHHSVIGNAVDLMFNHNGLTFDTVMMPAQVNMGFTVFDAVGAAVAITSVTIVGPNRVRILCASAPQPGWRVKYGHINVVGKTNYTGCGGNLRDNLGDRIVYAAINKPMHRWSIIFNYEV